MARRLTGLLKNNLGRRISRRLSRAFVSTPLVKHSVRSSYPEPVPLLWRGIGRRLVQRRPAPTFDMLARLRERQSADSGGESELPTAGEQPGPFADTRTASSAGSAVLPPREGKPVPTVAPGRTPMKRTAIELKAGPQPVPADRTPMVAEQQRTNEGEEEFQSPESPTVQTRVAREELTVAGTEIESPQEPDAIAPGVPGPVHSQIEPLHADDRPPTFASSASSTPKPVQAKIGAEPAEARVPAEAVEPPEIVEPTETIEPAEDVGPAAEPVRNSLPTATAVDADDGSVKRPGEKQPAPAPQRLPSTSAGDRLPPTAFQETIPFARSTRVQESPSESTSSPVHSTAEPSAEAQVRSEPDDIPVSENAGVIPAGAYAPIGQVRPGIGRRKWLGHFESTSEYHAPERVQLLPEDSADDEGSRPAEGPASPIRDTARPPLHLARAVARQGAVQRSPTGVLGATKGWSIKRDLPLSPPDISLRLDTHASPVPAPETKPAVESPGASTPDHATATQPGPELRITEMEPPSAAPLMREAQEDTGTPVRAAPAPGESGTAKSASSYNLDTMAREVYDILSRRLRVEHERTYGWRDRR